MAPANRRAWRLYEALGTQWDVSMAGVTGLNYGRVEAVARMLWGPDAVVGAEDLARLQLLEALQLEELRKSR